VAQKEKYIYADFDKVGKIPQKEFKKYASN
jgi:hypothetical protein